MKQITIKSGVNGTQNVLVDNDDYERLIQHKWFVYRCTFKGKKARTMYAVTHINGKTFRMHRLIMGVTDPKVLIDHNDHNGLNNQKHNLRLATHKQNQSNMRPFKNNKTGFKGVSFHKKDKKYMVFMRILSCNKYFGSFNTPEEAALKYNEIARIHHGEFAYQNPV